jgi:hypothetical protein
VEAETGNPESARAVVRAGALLVAHIDTSASTVDSRWRAIRPNYGEAHSRSIICNRSVVPAFGGHFTEPKEQKTQQSPGFGRNIVPQFVHS